MIILRFFVLESAEVGSAFLAELAQVPNVALVSPRIEFLTQRLAYTDQFPTGAQKEVSDA